MKIAQRSSKRIKTKTRAKIAKKAREHRRKAKKASKNNKFPEMKKKHHIEIPRSAPFKKDLLKEIQKMKEDKQNRQQFKQKMAHHQVITQKRKEFTQKSRQEKTPEISENITKSNNFSSQLNHVIEKADLLIKVIDARDPLNTRCLELEQRIQRQRKLIILLLNKVDLIPKENCLTWLKYLRNEYPTMPFKADKNQRENFVSNLFSSIKIASGKSSIVVGVVGFPNVGKSSVINSLKGSKCCDSGSIAGITRDLKEIRLDKRLRLIDSPGVILNPQKYKQSDLVLLNCVDITKVSDPLNSFEAILQRCQNEDELVRFYRLPITEEPFLVRLARKYGYFKKGGVANVNLSAMKVLRDWTCGRLLYHTKPPKATLDHILSSKFIHIESDNLEINDADDTFISANSDNLCKPSIELTSNPLLMTIDVQNDKRDNLELNNADDTFISANSDNLCKPFIELTSDSLLMTNDVQNDKSNDPDDIQMKYE
ncbi:hypothetical protein GJ496_010074 [Pomphorhynchus laevis]|nr:hypothetical protein GJ496_010074 [Pomphorhynchus laevis]